MLFWRCVMGKLYKEYCRSYKLSKNNSDGFLKLTDGIYNSREIQSLAQYEHHLEINRLQHIAAVVYISYKICKHLGWNYKAAARGACMHDLFYYDWKDGENGKWHKLHGYKHPKYALLNAKELCPDITNLELNIILRHMWPFTVVPPKYKEGYVVSFADKYCAAREIMYSMNKKYKRRFLADVEKVSG